MMAAVKKDHLKKKRWVPIRTRRSDPLSSPPEARRSLRPRQTRYLADLEDELDLDVEEEEQESKERRKLKVVLKLPPISAARCRDSSPVTAPKSRTSPPSDYSPSISSRSATSASEEDEDEEEDEEIVKPLKKRKIDRVQDSDGSGQREKSKVNGVLRPIRAASGTPMPKIDELEEILDKLQKKDTYKAFAEPVDPQELPDYHDVIEHPMDFGTIRRKLLTEKYRTFEQFEDDVFLICSNAMQYNTPDTIYFRQAHSIEDIARRNFEEIRTNLMSKRAERKFEPFREKNTTRKLHTGISSRPSSFDISSSEKKTLRPPFRNAVELPAFDIPSMETKSVKKKCRTAPKPPGRDFSFMEKKTVKKPQHRTADKLSGSGFSSMESERKILKKPQHRTAPELRGPDVSSMEMKTIKKSQFRTAPEPPSSNISSMEKRKLKELQCRTVPEQLDSNISSMEKLKLKKLQYKTEPEPLSSGLSSQDKMEQQEEHLKTSTPESFGSDVSSGATLASAAEAFTDLSKIHDNSDTPAAEPCTEVGKIQPSEAAVEAEACIELITVKGSSIERSNGPAGGSSCLSESKSEKADEVPAKCSPSKLAMKPFVVDVNCRATYTTVDKQSVSETDSIFDVFDGETRQLVYVGLNSEYSYARSLSRFASCLGPIGWEIASKKIQQALPPAVKFDPGWVGEYERRLNSVLSLDNNSQQQHKLALLEGKGKGNEIKSETSSAVWRKDNGNKSMAQTTKNGQYKDTPFGCTNQMATIMPSNRASSSSNVQREKTQEQKRGLFGVNLQLKPCTSKVTQQQQKNPPGNFAKAHTNEGADQRVDICSEPSKYISPPVISRGWNPVQTEAQQLQHQKNPPAGDSASGYTNETAGHRIDICFEGTKSTSPAIISRGWNPVKTEGQKLQQPKNQVAQVQRTCANEISRNQPDSHPKSQIFNFPAVKIMGRNQVQNEPLKEQPEAAPRRNDSLVMNVGGLNNWISSDGSLPSGTISNNQAGVQHWLARGSQEQAAIDPLRWMNSSVKNSHQLNAPNRSNTNLRGFMPPVQVPKRENSNAPAAQAWMPIGGFPNKQPESAPFNPNWKTPTPASRVYEEATIKPEPIQSISESPLVQTEGLVIFPQLMTTDLSRLRSPWQGVVQQNKQKDTLPPDLNISFQPPASPARSSSGIHIDSQQPDLALQL